MNELDTIAKKHGTDKSTGRKGHGYTLIYEQYFEPIRYEPLVILEIGVKLGASLRTWEEYFPNAMIYGIDIREKCKKYETDRIKILIGDQGSADFLDKIMAEDLVGSPSIIIDDGSHWPPHQVFGLTHLFPYLDYGGMYIIEDLQSSYGTSRHRSYHLGHPDSAMVFLKTVLDDLNYPFHKQVFTNFTHFLKAVCFYLNLVVVLKKASYEVRIGAVDIILELIVKNNLKKIAHVGASNPKLCKGVLAPYGVRKNIEEYWTIDEWKNENNYNLIAGLRSWAFNLRLLKAPLGAASAYFDTNYFDMVILELPPDYDLVRLVIQHWKAKIKVGGFLVGYGYNRRGWEALTRAVKEELGEVSVYPSYTWVKQL